MSEIATVAPSVARFVRGLVATSADSFVCGPAFTVEGHGGDNLAIHHALDRAPAGSVLVVDVQDNMEGGHWGELMTIRAQYRGIAGLVINGSTRDEKQVRERRFPLFHLGINPFPASKKKPGALAMTIVFRGIEISPGDLVVGDADGVLVVPSAQAEMTLKQAHDLSVKEAEIAGLLRGGASLATVLGLAPWPGD